MHFTGEYFISLLAIERSKTLRYPIVEWTVLKAIMQCKFKMIPPIYTFNLARMLTQKHAQIWKRVQGRN